jgi:hypothetical protein
LQCAAAREQLWSAEANRLWEEIGRVWNRLYYEWLPAMQASWPQRGTDNLDAIHFHRGFLNPQVRVTTTLLAFVARVWDWFPTREVNITLTESAAALELLATDPRMRRIRCIETASWLGLAFERGPEEAAILDAFLRSPHLCNLTHFDLGSHWVQKSTLAVLLSASSIPRSTELIVSFLPAENYEAGSEFAELLPGTVTQLRERFPNVVIVND